MEFNKWPKGGLEKTLKEQYDGASSAWNAVRKVLNKDNSALKDSTAAQSMNPPQDDVVKTLSLVTKELELALSNYDYTKRPEIVKSLADMPLNSASQILAWRDAWLDEARASQFA